MWKQESEMKYLPKVIKSEWKKIQATKVYVDCARLCHPFKVKQFTFLEMLHKIILQVLSLWSN